MAPTVPELRARCGSRRPSHLPHGRRLPPRPNGSPQGPASRHTDRAGPGAHTTAFGSPAGGSWTVPMTPPGIPAVRPSLVHTVDRPATQTSVLQPGSRPRARPALPAAQRRLRTACRYCRHLVQRQRRAMKTAVVAAPEGPGKAQTPRGAWSQRLDPVRFGLPVIGAATLCRRRLSGGLHVRTVGTRAPREPGKPARQGRGSSGLEPAPHARNRVTRCARTDVRLHNKQGFHTPAP
jgi:hypothetical protein